MSSLISALPESPFADAGPLPVLSAQVRAEFQEDLVGGGIALKTCKKCSLTYDYFYCKPCQKIYGDAYRAKNAAQIKIRKAADRKKHSENRKAYQKEWCAKNPDWDKKWRKEYFTDEANKKRHNANSAKYYKAHPEVKKIQKHNRRALLKSRGKLSKDIVEKLFRLQRGKCPCCRLPLSTDFHLDHKVPLALGGVNEDWNMQLLRGACNLQKNSKDPVQFMQSRGFLL